MKTIYIDKNNKCHLVDDGTMLPVETEALDTIADLAIEYFLFAPKGTLYNGVVCADDFLQCLDGKIVDAIQSAVDRITAEKDAEIAEINEAMMDFVAMVEEV